MSIARVYPEPEIKIPPILDEKDTKLQENSKKEEQQVQQQAKRMFADSDKLSRIQKYEEIDTYDIHNKKFIAVQGFNGPKISRTTTDKFWIIFFILIVLVSLVYGIQAISNGATARLGNGLDFRGEICGVGKLKKLPFLYYANPIIDQNVAWCVATCPEFSGTDICIYDIDHRTPTQFCYTQMQADKFGHICVPKEPSNRQVIMNYLNLPSSVLLKIVSDIFKSWDLIAMFTIFCILLSWFLAVLARVRCLIGFLIWLGVSGTAVSLGAFSYLTFAEAERIRKFNCIPGTNPKNCGGSSFTTIQTIGYLLATIGGMYFIYIVCTFGNIKKGVELLKKEQKSMQVLSQMRSFSILIVLIAIAIGALFFIIIVNGMTVGSLQLIDAQNIDGGKVWKLIPDENMKNMNIFGVFSLVFIMVLLLVFHDLYISYAVSVWYFTKQKDLVSVPILSVVKNLLRYHFGSCVFITFNLMFLQVPKYILGHIRFILGILPQQLPGVRYSQAVCMFGIHVYEKFLRYVSLHSIVQIAIWSEPYLECSKKAYYLLFRNRDKIKDLDQLQQFVVNQLQIFSAFIGALPLYVYLMYYKETPLNGIPTDDIEMPIVPTIFVFISNYFFTAIFQGSYDILSKSIIQLYLIDQEMFYGEQSYTEPFIKEFMEFIQNEKVKDTFQQRLFAQEIFLSELQKQSEELSEEEISEQDEQMDEKNLQNKKFSQDQVTAKDNQKNVNIQKFNYVQDESKDKSQNQNIIPVDELQEQQNVSVYTNIQNDKSLLRPPSPTQIIHFKKPPTEDNINRSFQSKSSASQKQNK